MELEQLRPVLLVFPNKTLRALSQSKTPPSLSSTITEDGRDCDDRDQPKDVSHNEVERRRKLKISHGIKQLSEILQETCSCGKQTRGEVLQNAVNKIQSLQEENEKLKSDIASLPKPGTEGELYIKLSDLLTEHLMLRLQLQDYFDKQQGDPHESSEEEVPCSHDHTPYPLNKPSNRDINTSDSSPIPIPHSDVPQTTSGSSQHWSVTSLLSCDQQPMSCDQENATNRFPNLIDSRHDVRYSTCHQDTYTHTLSQSHPHENHTHQSQHQHQTSGVIVQPWVRGSGSTRPWTQHQDVHAHIHHRSGGSSIASHPRGVHQEEWQRTYHHTDMSMSSRHLEPGRYPTTAVYSNYRRHGNDMPHPYVGHPSLVVDHPTPTPVMYSTSSQVHSQGQSSSYLQSHMPCDLTTPPYPLFSVAHPTSNSTVWRPYSEPPRPSGFCLTDILSLSPHETDAQQLHLEPTTNVSNKFLVDRLLDDI